MSRDNANQVTLNDGVPGITNMYLWQPIAGAFYPPCVDGDYDMAVIGHEYTHAISNRMAGGPDASLTGTQARAMGESWSDLAAMEFLNEFNLVPTNNESRYAVGAYATGNRQRGIRNYNMSTSPLNYSDVGYDFVCNAPLVAPEIEGTCPDGRTQVHADGEIWTCHQLRPSPGARQQVQRQQPGLEQRPPEGVRRGQVRAPTSARATAAGRRSCSTRGCSCRPR